MKILIIVGHPHLENSRYNKKLLSTLGDNVTIHDIGKLQLTQQQIEKEHQLIAQYDKIVFQYPIYWAGWPAVMQNYIEHIVTGGKFYSLVEGQKSEFAGKTFAFAVTTGADRSEFNQDDFDVVNGQGKVLSDFCGMKYGGIWIKFHEEPINQEKIDSYIKFINQ